MRLYLPLFLCLSLGFLAGCAPQKSYEFDSGFSYKLPPPPTLTPNPSVEPLVAIEKRLSGYLCTFRSIAGVTKEIELSCALPATLNEDVDETVRFLLERSGVLAELVAAWNTFPSKDGLADYDYGLWTAKAKTAADMDARQTQAANELRQNFDRYLGMYRALLVTIAPQHRKFSG